MPSLSSQGNKLLKTTRARKIVSNQRNITCFQKVFIRQTSSGSIRKNLLNIT
jgi:hypothetical protein